MVVVGQADGSEALKILSLSALRTVSHHLKWCIMVIHLIHTICVRRGVLCGVLRGVFYTMS